MSSQVASLTSFLKKSMKQKEVLTYQQKKFNITDLIRPLIYVPPSMTLGTLLQKMQAERIHMALVIDEYGGVEGLLTIEDLLEQIVGEIND